MQLPKDECLLLYETSSIPQGYLSINNLLESFDLHLLEVSPIAPGRLMVLANPFLKDLKKAFELVKTSLKDQLIEIAAIEHIQKEVLFAFYGLAQAPLQDMLLVMETSSSVSAIKITSDLSSKKLVAPIEIRSSRSLGNKSLVYATFKKEQQSQIKMHLNQKRQVLDFVLIPASHSYWHSLF